MYKSVMFFCLFWFGTRPSPSRNPQNSCVQRGVYGVCPFHAPPHAPLVPVGLGSTHRMGREIPTVPEHSKNLVRRRANKMRSPRQAKTYLLPAAFAALVVRSDGFLGVSVIPRLPPSAAATTSSSQRCRVVRLALTPPQKPNSGAGAGSTAAGGEDGAEASAPSRITRAPLRITPNFQPQEKRRPKTEYRDITYGAFLTEESFDIAGERAAFVVSKNQACEVREPSASLKVTSALAAIPTCRTGLRRDVHPGCVESEERVGVRAGIYVVEARGLVSRWNVNRESNHHLTCLK